MSQQSTNESIGVDILDKMKLKCLNRNDESAESIDSRHCNDDENCRLYCGRIPADVRDGELSELFEKFGLLIECSLCHRGKSMHSFAFMKFDSQAARNAAVASLNNHEIRPKQHLKVSNYRSNRCLYLGNISKSKDVVELRADFERHIAGIDDVIIYRSTEHRQFKNRGFCFVRFESLNDARAAKRFVARHSERIFGHTLFVDWADVIEAPDDNAMNEVRILYVRNLSTMIDERRLCEVFGEFGTIERVKKLKEFAFVHFMCRNDALVAMQSLNGTELGGECIEIELSRPPIDKRRKEEILRAREQRMRASTVM